MASDGHRRRDDSGETDDQFSNNYGSRSREEQPRGPHFRHPEVPDDDPQPSYDRRSAAAHERQSDDYLRQWCTLHPTIAGLTAAAATVVVVALVVVTGWAWSLSSKQTTSVVEKGRSEQLAREAEKIIQDAEAKIREAERKARAAEMAAQMADARARMAEQNARAGQQIASGQPVPPKPDWQAGPRPSNIPAQPKLEPVVENPRSLYAMHIRLARQAWDRGETRAVRELLEPYRRDPMKQGLRDFAWYYLWRAAYSEGTSALRHTQPVRQAAFTYEGDRVVTLCDDRTLAIWDLNGKRVGQITLDAPTTMSSASPLGGRQTGFGLRPARLASGLALGPDGLWAVAFGNVVSIGNLDQPGGVLRLEDSMTTIQCLAMERRGRMLATGDDQGQILVRELPTGRVLQRLRAVRPRALAITPDMKNLLCGTQDGNLMAWDLATGALQLSEPCGAPVTSLAVSPDGATVAVALADRDGVVRLWDLATRRVRAELRGHNDEVTRVAFSPDGKSLLTASRDQTARLWNIAGGLLKTLKGHVGELETAAFSPDGQRLVTGGSDQQAILWYTDIRQDHEDLPGTPPLGWINSLTFTPDGTRIVAAGNGEGAEAFLSLWNLGNTSRPVPLQSTPKAATAVAVSPDTRMVAVGEGSPDGAAGPSRVRIWNLESGRLATTLSGTNGMIRTLGYSPDGRFMLATTGDTAETTPGEAILWDMTTGTLARKLSEMFGKVEATFTPDGRALLTICSSQKRPGDVRLWNPATGDVLLRIDQANELADLSTMALSPDGRWLVTGHGDLTNPRTPGRAKLKLWDLTARRLAMSFPPAHAATVTKVVFSRRGKLLATGDAAGNVRVWDFTQQKPLPVQVAAQSAAITGLAFDLLGDRIVTAAEENCLRVWHVDTGRQLARLDLTSGTPAAVRFTPDGYGLVATTTTGGTILWDSEGLRQRALLGADGSLAGRGIHAGEVTCSTMTTSGRRLITGGADKTVRAWDIQSGRFESTAFTFKQPIACITALPEGRRMAIATGRTRSGFEPGEVLVCQFVGPDKQPSTQVLLKQFAAQSMAASADGNTLAVCGTSAEAQRDLTATALLVDVKTGRSTPLATRSPQSVAIAPDGRTVAVGRTTGQIELWSIDAAGNPGSRPVILQGHGSQVASLCFAPDGKTLASGGYDHNVRLWDLVSGEELLTMKHNGAVEAVRFSPDGRILAAADRGELRGGVRLWRAATDVR